MIRLKFLIAINFFSLSVIAQSNYKRALQLMGCDFEITVVAENPEKGQAAIALAVDEVRRIERLISSWDPNSQTAAINRSAGIRPVKVSAELF